MKTNKLHPYSPRIQASPIQFQRTIPNVPDVEVMNALPCLVILRQSQKPKSEAVKSNDRGPCPRVLHQTMSMRRQAETSVSGLIVGESRKSKVESRSIVTP
jgi:hypothetical protein